MGSEIRIAMMQAVEERGELGHELLGPDHLLLGLLSNVRGTAYELLAEQGVTYDWARRVVAEKHDDRRNDDDSDAPDEATDNLDEDREALKAIGTDLDKVRDAVRDTFGEDITERWGQRRGRGRRERGPDGGARGERREDRRDDRHDRGEHRGPGPHHGGPWGRGPWGPDAETLRDEFGGGFAGFGPGGRGRRGPRSRRFEQVTPSMRRLLRGLRGELRAAQSASCDHERGLSAGVVLAAILGSGDPAVDAVIDAADNPDALRAAVDALAGRATA
ncbi:Clp protease N-terminal domain-containing protein [Flexivirga endophytica]|nr:Clp protease N-terminal domain-containing protein [Flexivirga endophytica]